MVWAVTLGTFLVTVGILVALYFVFTSSDAGIAQRLKRIGGEPGAQRETLTQEKPKYNFQESLASIGKLLPGQSNSRVQLMLVRAGYRRPETILALRGVKILLPFLLVGIVYFSGLYLYNPILVIAGALLAGFLLPELWLLMRISARQKKLRRGLPDALDLLVICVEAGLGLDQSMLRVSEELRVVHPDLSDELQLVNLEMRIGKTRLEALRDLAKRTGVEDIKALVAMLAQTERFGTSIASSLRVHSDDLRTKRRQRAEEMAAKTTVKMVPALVIFIFPALMVVILGPAVLIMMREFINAGR